MSLPCFTWHHIAVMQDDHPLLERKLLSLDDLTQYPLITYESAFAGRTKINEAFRLRGLHPDIVLEAIDAGRDQGPTSNWGSASASWPTSRSTRNATAICARCRSAICSAAM